MFRGIRRVFGSKHLTIALAALMISSVAVASFVRNQQEMAPLPVISTLPEFELIDQMSQPFGTSQLRNQPWIANFIFTRCPTVCPVFTQKMAQVQKRTRGLGSSLRLVSFSVDPDWDTPEVLANYAAKFGADPDRWKFLTGAPASVRATVRDGLKMAMERQGMVGDVPDILHGTHFVLMDQASRIRGYYESSDPKRIDQMIEGATQLVHATNAAQRQQ